MTTFKCSKKGKQTRKVISPEIGNTRDLKQIQIRTVKQKKQRNLHCGGGQEVLWLVE